VIRSVRSQHARRACREVARGRDDTLALGSVLPFWFVLGFGLTVGCLGNRWRYGDMCPRLNRWTLRIGLGLLAVAVVWIVVGFIFTGTEVWPSH